MQVITPNNAKTESYKFALGWNNNTQRNAPMSHRTVTLRDIGPHSFGHALTAQELHLDHVQIVFRPTTDINGAELMRGDSLNFTWRVETSQLMVRTRPGQQHVLFTLNDLNGLRDAGAPTNSREPHRSVLYSQALALAPDVQGAEDYWVRNYRPIRDLPIATNLQGVSELEVDLIFPLLFDEPLAPSTYVPDYRILKVYMEFSVKP